MFVVEGPSDVLALQSSFEAPAVAGVPGAGAFSDDWLPAFYNLSQLVIVGDNDGPGAKFRSRVDMALAPVVDHIVHLFVPEPYNDIDDWRRAVEAHEPDSFGPLFAQKAEEAELQQKRCA